MGLSDMLNKLLANWEKNDPKKQNSAEERVPSSEPEVRQEPQVSQPKQSDILNSYIAKIGNASADEQKASLAEYAPILAEIKKARGEVDKGISEEQLQVEKIKQAARDRDGFQSLGLSGAGSLVDYIAGTNMAPSLKSNRNKMDEEKQILAALKDIQGSKERSSGLAMKEASIRGAMAKTKGQAKKPLISGGQVAQIADLEDQMSTVAALDSEWDNNASKIGSSAMGLIPQSDARVFDKTTRVISAQKIGKALEGGKLTEPDFQRYLALMPSTVDTKETKDKKIATLKLLIENAKNAKISNFESSGYDVKDLKTTGSAPAQKQGGKNRPSGW